MNNKKGEEKSLSIGHEHKDLLNIPPLASSGLVVPIKHIVHNILGHTANIYSVILSSDRKYIITGSADLTVLMWHVESGQCIKRFSGHDSAVTTLFLSEDNKTLTTGTDQGKALLVWDVRTEKVIREFRGDDDSSSIHLSRDGKYGLISSIDYANFSQSIIVIDLKNGSEIQSFTINKRQLIFMNSIFVSDGCRYLVIGHSSGKIGIWDVFRGKLVQYFEDDSYDVQDIFLSKNGKYLASTGRSDKKTDLLSRYRKDSHARIWSVSEGRYFRNFECYNFSTVFITDDSKYLAVGSHYSVDFYNIHSGTCENKFHIEKEGWSHHERLNVSISPDNKYLVMSGGDCTKTTTLWNMNSQQIIRSFVDDSSNMGLASISGNGRFLMTKLYSGYSVKIWDVQTGLPINVLSSDTFDIGPVLSSDGRYVASSNGVEKDIELYIVTEGGNRYIKIPHYSTTYYFSNNDRWLVVKDIDRLKLIEIKTGRCFRTYERNKKDRSSLIMTSCMSADSKYLILCINREIRAIEVASDKLTMKIPIDIDNQWVKRMFLTQDNRYLFTSHKDFIIRKWDIMSGECVGTFEEHESEVNFIFVNKEGKTLISADKQQILFWNIEKRKCFKRLNRKENRVSQASASHNCQYFVTSNKNVVHFRDTSSGYLLGTLYNFNNCFLWTTPPDETAKSGWFWTDRPELLHIFRSNDKDSEKEPLYDGDPERASYFSAFNRQDMVMNRLNNHDLYLKNKNKLKADKEIRQAAKWLTQKQQKRIGP